VLYGRWAQASSREEEASMLRRWVRDDPVDEDEARIGASGADQDPFVAMARDRLDDRCLQHVRIPVDDGAELEGVVRSQAVVRVLLAFREDAARVDRVIAHPAP